ncbi:hypothetical protein [Bacillus phage vB_BanS-Thrax5]|nr:hypothetical protein [Bacillus phage vB_BanS-Thrax5]
MDVQRTIEDMNENKEIEVTEKLFNYFIKWYSQDVHPLHGEANTISDRINYKTKDGQVVAYKYLYITNSYYINEEFYKLMFDKD